MIAARHGNEKIIDLLLKQKQIIENINAKSNEGCTALGYAFGLREWRIAKILEDAGANLSGEKAIQ